MARFVGYALSWAMAYALIMHPWWDVYLGYTLVGLWVGYAAMLVLLAPNK